MIFNNDDELDEEDVMLDEYRAMLEEPMATGKDFVKAIDDLRSNGFIVSMTPSVQKLYDDVKEEHDGSS